ncbi:rRNA methyltransferase 3, mitochondrial [Uranotaenia lowii]|uniref:rRNA methyltransferase 3, mitochondrial n=1 Tax=Uranotaenia lowii TaxID=190385 RepID=UPI002478E090|nr:rRNA methyltransferase 3, mitochondrial [Uranotaenia lowii]
MQFAKSCRVLMLNILKAGPLGQTPTRNLCTFGGTCWFRILPSLTVPRGLNRVSSHSENVYPEQERKFRKSETPSDVHGTEDSKHRAVQCDEIELEEIERNLFNNSREIKNLKLENLTKSVEEQSHKKVPKTARKDYKSDKTFKNHVPNALDADTFKIMNRFQSTDKPKEIFDGKMRIKYIQLKSHHREFSDLELLLRSRKKRETLNKLLLEGRRLILDGLSACLELDTILFHDLELLKCLGSKNRNIKFIQLPKHVLQQWSDLVTCPGIIGIFNKPESMSDIMIRNETTVPLPITVLCDNIREPNNLGSIIRSCAAMPVRNVVLLKGCAYPWEPKCLRGGAGAHFRVNINGPVAMNELEELIPKHASFLVADNEPNRSEKNLAFSRYDAANYRDMEHVVLVIGGETHGISSDLRKFIADFPRPQEATNHTVHIPLENGVESLNTAAALTVILCEIRRQLNYVFDR